MKITQFLKYAFCFLVFVSIAGYIAFHLSEDAFYKKAIPAHIKIEQVLMKKSRGFILRPCGGVIFKISASTVDDIKKNGVQFLDKDLYGQGYKEDKKERYYYIYEKWVETPVNIKEGIASGLNCLLLDADLLRDDNEMAPIVRNAIKQQGSYYTKKREGELLLIPSMGLLFFAYSG